MKKAVTWILWITLIIALGVFSVMGIKIFDGNSSEIYTEACIGAVCFAIVFICIIIRAFESKCPHCGKHILTNGKYCSYCGKQIKE